MVVYNNILAGSSGTAPADTGPYQISKSLRFNREDTSYLSRTPTSAGNRKIFTFSCWLKKSGVNSSNRYQLLSSYASGSAYFTLEFETEKLKVFDGSAISGGLATDEVFRDPSAWYHIVCAVNTTDGTAANRVKLYVNGVQKTLTGTQPAQNSDLSINTTTSMSVGTLNTGSILHTLDGYLADVHFVDGVSGLTASDFGELDSNNVWQAKAYSGTYGTNGFRLNFNDTTSDLALGYDASVNSPALNNRGGFDALTYTGTGSNLTIKGLAFQPDLVWIKRTDGAAYHSLHDSVRGLNSELSSNATDSESTAGKFTSFNPDGWSMKGGYGTLNLSGQTFAAWAWKAGGPAVRNTDGSITSEVSASSEYGFSVVTFTVPSSTPYTVGHGLGSVPKLIILKSRTGSSANWNVYHNSTGNQSRSYLNLTNTASSGESCWNNTSPTSSVFSMGSSGEFTGDMVAYCWSEVSGYSKFDSYSGGTNPQTITTGFKPRFLLIKRTDTANHWMLIDSERGGTKKLGADSTVEENNNATLGDASQNIVEFLDNGFKLTTTNAGTNVSGGTYIYAAFGDRVGNNFTPNNLIASSGIETANQGMDVVTWTANGSNQSITGLGFQPDLIWAKSRNTGTTPHLLVDSVRGVSKALSSHSTAAEEDYSGISGVISAFNSDGFDTGGNSDIATNNRTFVAWCWKAGGAASSNSDGSITSSVSANNTYGFSIATYTGTGSNATVGHGLTSAPKFIIVKRTDDSANWQVYHSSRGETEYGALNTTEAFTSSGGTSRWNDTAPTNSVFTVGTAGTTNGSGNDYVAYCWSEIPGFSRFSSYTGTGATGNKVTTGFKPRFVMVKRTTNISGSHMGWVMVDSKRGHDKRLSAQSSAQENDGPINAASSPNDDITFQDDGFTLASGGSATNGNTETYVYMAFADAPPEIVDSLIDTPTDITANSGNNPGNYCTWNPLKQTSGTYSDGNLKVATSAGNKHYQATFGLTSGKWYWEVIPTAGSTPGMIGIALDTKTLSSNLNGSGAMSYYSASGNKQGGNTSGVDASYGSSYTYDDVIGVALDLDSSTKTLTFYKNGVSQGVAFNPDPTLGSWHPAISAGSSSNTTTFVANFGQRGSFVYTPPTGYKSLCTTNLADPTIADGSVYFDVGLWTGTGSAQTVSLGFNPDMIWSKTRSHAVDHKLVDSVRGLTEVQEPNQARVDSTNSNGITATSSTGFTVGTSGDFNANNRSYCAWAWDAGSSTVSNTDGSITSDVRANASAGFSVVKFEGDRTAGSTVGHGLNAAPELVIVKNRESTSNWMVYHKDAGHGGYLALNTNAAYASASSVWNNTAPTSSVFTLGADSESNGDESDMIAYCFTSVENYSSIGSFVGNGTTDNSFVYTGFRPKFILLKYSSHAGDWLLLDTNRRPNGPSGGTLVANVSNAEDGYYTNTQANIDFLSNGFKIRVTGSPFGDSGRTVVYAAFADRPFKYSRAY